MTREQISRNAKEAMICCAPDPLEMLKLLEPILSEEGSVPAIYFEIANREIRKRHAQKSLTIH
jgi:hypothetical protein